MKRVYLIFLVLMVIISAKAEEIYKNEVGVSVGLDTNDAYELEASYRYFLTQNVAIGAGVGFYQQYFCDEVPSGDLNDGKWTSWRMADDDVKIKKFFLEPTVTLRTPALLIIGKARLCLEGEAGLKMQIPTDMVSVDYYNSQTNDAKSSVKFIGRGRWCFWETKALFRLGFPKISLSLGYAFSNLDIYTNYRRMTVEHVSFASFYPKKKQTQTFFLKLSFPM